MQVYPQNPIPHPEQKPMPSQSSPAINGWLAKPTSIYGSSPSHPMSAENSSNAFAESMHREIHQASSGSAQTQPGKSATSVSSKALDTSSAATQGEAASAPAPTSTASTSTVLTGATAAPVPPATNLQSAAMTTTSTTSSTASVPTGNAIASQTSSRHKVSLASISSPSIYTAAQAVIPPVELSTQTVPGPTVAVNAQGATIGTGNEPSSSVMANASAVSSSQPAGVGGFASARLPVNGMPVSAQGSPANESATGDGIMGKGTAMLATTASPVVSPTQEKPASAAVPSTNVAPSNILTLEQQSTALNKMHANTTVCEAQKLSTQVTAAAANTKDSSIIGVSSVGHTAAHKTSALIPDGQDASTSNASANGVAASEITSAFPLNVGGNSTSSPLNGSSNASNSETLATTNSSNLTPGNAADTLHTAGGTSIASNPIHTYATALTLSHNAGAAQGFVPAGATAAASQGVAGASGIGTNPTSGHALTAAGGNNLPGALGGRAASAPLPTSSDAMAAIEHGVEPSHLLQVGPHQLAVGITDPQLGWVEVRAERVAGQISAQVTANSTDSHAVLAASMPAMVGFLHDQHAGVQHLTVANSLAGNAGNAEQGSYQQNSSNGGSQQQSGADSISKVAGVSQQRSPLVQTSAPVGNFSRMAATPNSSQVNVHA